MYLAKMYFEGKEIYESSKYRENRYVYVEPFLKYLAENTQLEINLLKQIRAFWSGVCRRSNL